MGLQFFVPDNKSEVKTFILVHGSWHGGWCWDEVKLLLEAAGNKVIIHDLPGHGEKKVAYEAYKDVTLDSYVESLTEVIKAQSNSVVLVGHSMGGAVITQVAEYLPEKIAELVYISGFIPANGETVLEASGKGKSKVGEVMVIDGANAAVSLKLETEVDKQNVKQVLYNTSPAHKADEAIKKLQVHPLNTYLKPLAYSEENFGRIKKVYIECLQDNAIDIGNQRRMHTPHNCDVAVLDTDHSPLISAPDLLVKAILDATFRAETRSENNQANTSTLSNN